uniref:GDSL esterase/lipase n=1 Tax=Kalanchoe fedtschenkoi TaxID=63787 RepID=A0A7N0U720_KALFE
MAAFWVGLCLVWGLVTRKPQVEAATPMFVFGDSLADNGNNNFLSTTARADNVPYGIDYPTHHPTGRFSNGRNIPDLIGERIGAKKLLPYLDPLIASHLEDGANFASAGVGVLNDTGIQFLNILRINRQLELFEQYQQRLAARIGEARAKLNVAKGLVLIMLGGNDFVNNYYLVPVSARRIQFPNITDYVRYVLSEYRKVLLRLHELGARKVLVTGSGAIGCAPAEMAMRRQPNGRCDPTLQRAARIYNPLLADLIHQLNAEVKATVYIAADTRGLNMDLIDNPQKYGFVTSKMACCGQGPYNGVGLCTPISPLCPNRDHYVYWDAFHPTEKADGVIVHKIMEGPLDHMTPMNLSMLLRLDSETKA